MMEKMEKAYSPLIDLSETGTKFLRFCYERGKL